MLKICFIVHNCADYGGVGTVTSNLVKELSNYYEVLIASILDDERPNAILSGSKIEITRFVSSGFRLRTQQRKLFIPLKQYIKSNKIDIVIAMGHYPGFLVSPACFASKTKVVFCDHGALINQWDDKKAIVMRYIASKVCDKTVVLTEKTLNDYIEKFHLNPQKITYIYNWIESSDSDSQKYDMDSRKLLSVGRLSEEKGFNQLMEAMSLIIKKHPDWMLDLYGDGEEKDRLNNLIKDLNLSENVILKGRCDNVRDYYKDYAAYVMPSYREGLPVTLLEAKINMLPIVSFDVNTGPREIVRDGKDGILVEPKNIKALADAMCTLIENRDLRKRYSDNAKGNLDLFSKEKIIPQWKELFEEIAR